jgi:hypothetical protein
VPKKIPIIELDLIDPHETRKRKFTCGNCGMTYTLKHYRILYDAEKLSYFIVNESAKPINCHQCIYEVAEKFKSKLSAKKIILKINTFDEQVILKL